LQKLAVPTGSSNCETLYMACFAFGNYVDLCHKSMALK